MQKLLILIIYIFPIHSWAVNLSFNGFGDLTFGEEFGDPGNADERAAFEANSTDNSPKNTYSGFNLAGTDFLITGDLSKKLIFQSEINLQVNRGAQSDIELDVERMYLTYSFNEKFNIKTGLFFTPIGYINRNLYARGWMMQSIRVRSFAEEELGFMPTHSTGVNIIGNFSVSKNDSIMYSVSMGNGRGMTPDKTTYARDLDSGKEVTALLEYRFGKYKNFRIGVSGWGENFVFTTDGTKNGPIRKFEERGIDIYSVAEFKKFGLLFEYASSEFKDKTVSKSHSFEAISGEVYYTFKEKVHPFIRFDKLNFSQGNAYYLLINNGQLYEIEYYSIGASWDWHHLNRLKIEVGTHKKGPRRNQVLAQTAWAF